MGSLLRRTVRVAAPLVGAVVLSTDPARAFETEVRATTDAQFYTLGSPYGDPVVRRRRYTQTLALGVYDLQGEPSRHGPRLDFRARLRLDADFGQEPAERDVNQGDRFVPGLAQAPVDLMYAYLEGRNYLDGLVGFRVGRQYVTDALGWWSFDGGLARVTTPAFVQAEVYGGFEQRGGLPLLGTDRFESDGVYRGRRTGMELGDWPSYLVQERPAPAYGFAIESAGVHWVHGRLTYRKVINRDVVLISPFADAGGGFVTIDGERTSSERLGYSARLSDRGLGAAKGTVVYDFYNQLVSEYDASLDWYATDALTLGAAWEYYLPTFDGDSIWNSFTHNGSTTVLGRADLDVTPDVNVVATGGVRLVKTDGDPETYGLYQNPLVAEAPDRDSIKQLSEPIGTLGGTYRWSDGSVLVHTMAETGDRGHRVGGDLRTKKTFDSGQYDVLNILSLYDWEDGLRPQRSATSFTYVVGGGVTPFPDTRMGVEWEHSMNRLVGQRFRMLATLDFTVLR